MKTDLIDGCKVVYLKEESVPTSEFVEKSILIVHDYEAGRYDGDGNCIGKTKDGKYYEHDMCHCSCYDEWENGFPTCLYDTFEELITKCGYLKDREVIKTFIEFDNGRV